MYIDICGSNKMKLKGQLFHQQESHYYTIIFNSKNFNTFNTPKCIHMM